MDDVKRYAVYDRHLSQGGGHEIEEDPDGDYVTYDDYAAQQARLAEVEAALVKAALERAAGIAAVCHRHVEYGPTFAPSQDIHHDTPAEIRDLDPAEIVKEWKESKNA